MCNLPLNCLSVSANTVSTQSQLGLSANQTPQDVVSLDNNTIAMSCASSDLPLNCLSVSANTVST
ncbi:MAG: hypothetical protein GTN35_03615 [Nitrososphaeria archaeon]|nr:hypothetical protein [Nitrosopumilaceae archaeon]NIP10107.1 hypothetical protein [Nitrosopumilaceae archaeon]NIP91471.1 hypothetical protein [Nitrososphaeria archaeon]NIS95306.1 hypothetical protein [Nitrosopumilaceae archaeon]